VLCDTVGALLVRAIGGGMGSNDLPGTFVAALPGEARSIQHGAATGQKLRPRETEPDGAIRWVYVSYAHNLPSTVIIVMATQATTSPQISIGCVAAVTCWSMIA